MVGSAPVAQAAALRRRLADVLEIDAREVTATVLGVPPHGLLSPQALAGSRVSVLPVVAWLDAAYGHRGLSLAVPARLGAGRSHGVLEVPLEPVEQIALDSAAPRWLARRL